MPSSGPFHVLSVTGMGIGHASQTFFFTAGFSMFSKVMGVRNNGARVATMASFAAMGSTLGPFSLHPLLAL